MRVWLVFFVTTIIIAICFLFFSRTSYIWLMNQARWKGWFPLPRKATIEDVKDLLQRGEKFLAIKLYSEMYKLSFQQAELEVDLLERNLKSPHNDHPR